ncbi:Tyrosine-sulfated glycopeptide receptor 1 [Abeliophyllum distichum]|uniref:Tyrosine-sulfated glycopeptide receptor 1 n=1 Tax=Abeliophyllum distichum TaxID=126358 RepID=A0ABD1P0M9_9LAMI
MPILIFLFLLLSCVQARSCNKLDRDSLLSFYKHISSSPPAIPLNWSSTNCCKWEGVNCNPESRVTHLSLPGKHLSGTIDPFLGNLTFLSYLNLSYNQLSGTLPSTLFHTLNHLESLDLSSNRFNGSIESPFFPSLISFNVSNNSFTGSLPSSICITSRFVKMLDFSTNKFSGNVSKGIGRCSKLEIFRAGFNSLSGLLPYDLYTVKTLREISLPNNQFSGPVNNSIALLSNLSIIDLHQNELTGEVPKDIGLLSNLKQLILHTNSLNGSVPPSLMNCTSLKTLLLRNNHLGGEIASLDFSKLQKLEAIDFGNNSFVGTIPVSLCLCRSLIAVRLAYNQLTGEIPACMAGIKSLSHLSMSDNFLSNVVGALRILMRCDNLSVLFLSRCYKDEPMPNDDHLLHLNGFQNLQILTLGGCLLRGEVPSWIGKLKKLKVLNLSYNQITGTIPKWLGSMPKLLVLNITRNHLTGDLPREIGDLKALASDDTDSDLSNLALPFLFDSLQYNRLFNLPRGIKVGNNSLSGNIPAELGNLRLLRELDLNDNDFNGSIPIELSQLVNLEKLDMSGNHLSGEIPESLKKLHFLSYFNVKNNDLEGEIPKGDQFDTFTNTSFEGNPKLCGTVLQRNCHSTTGGGQGEKLPPAPTAEESETSWYTIPFGLGYSVGFFVVSVSLAFRSSRKWFN